MFESPATKPAEFIPATSEFSQRASEPSAFQPLFSSTLVTKPFTTRHTQSEPEVKVLADRAQIDLIHEDDKVQKIVITCICCRQIELDCTY
ncbi:MAG: hypothetical protein NTX04_04130 [Verrucomicrobia bacterium]|nr:hypothetical protein [Verrucomicrobiota bacterium]